MPLQDHSFIHSGKLTEPKLALGPHRANTTGPVSALTTLGAETEKRPQKLQWKGTGQDPQKRGQHQERLLEEAPRRLRLRSEPGGARADPFQFFLILIIILNPFIINYTIQWWLSSLNVVANKKINYPMSSIRRYPHKMTI